MLEILLLPVPVVIAFGAAFIFDMPHHLAGLAAVVGLFGLHGLSSLYVRHRLLEIVHSGVLSDLYMAGYDPLFSLAAARYAVSPRRLGGAFTLFVASSFAILFGFKVSAAVLAAAGLLAILWVLRWNRDQPGYITIEIEEILAVIRMSETPRTTFRRVFVRSLSIITLVALAAFMFNHSLISLSGFIALMIAVVVWNALIWLPILYPRTETVTPEFLREGLLGESQAPPT